MNSPLATETSTSTTVANPNNNVCCISTRTLAEHRSRSTTATTQTTTVNCSSAHCKRASPPRRCRNDLDVQGLVFSDNTRGKADEITCDFDELYRKFKQNKRDSTGTLNRLILVAQALESEVESHQRISISDSRIVLSIRTVNLFILILTNILIATGVGHYHNSLGDKQSLMLTVNKWSFRSDLSLPVTFAEMRLSGQYLALLLTLIAFTSTFVLEVLHICRTKNSRFICMCHSFSSVPLLFLVFGIEMHYSACPWLNEFYRREMVKRNFNVAEPFFDAQCGINGWTLAGILSLFSCGLFICQGLVCAFLRSDPQVRRARNDDIL